MSKYYEFLGSIDKARYRPKLQAVGLTREVNPYSKESGRNFETNMTIWPLLEYSPIFGYFITYPGFDTLEQLLSWKQLLGYNYSGTSMNGHLVKAVTYRITASIAAPERPPYIHNIVFYS